MDKIKKILNKLPDWLILPTTFLFFVVLWPILFILIGVKSLFSEKSSDSEKITGAKLAILTSTGIMGVVVISKYEDVIKNFSYKLPWSALIVFILIGLFILVIFQKLFPKWKWFQQKNK